ncbi:MAG: hypothetical protein H0X24_21545 [Ktedonobacterales bacterium]|nr:hypothetical protein [Ktedonobacterales bacterium]
MLRAIHFIPLSLCVVLALASCSASTTTSVGQPMATATLAVLPTFAPLPTVPPPVAQNIRWITMTDLRNGWALTAPTMGTNAAQLDVDATSRLLVTSDGGQNWSLVS